LGRGTRKKSTGIPNGGKGVLDLMRGEVSKKKGEEEGRDSKDSERQKSSIRMIGEWDGHNGKGGQIYKLEERKKEIGTKERIHPPSPRGWEIGTSHWFWGQTEAIFAKWSSKRGGRVLQETGWGRLTELSDKRKDGTGSLGGEIDSLKEKEGRFFCGKQKSKENAWLDETGKNSCHRRGRDWGSEEM